MFLQGSVRTLGLMRDDDENRTLQKQKAYIYQRCNNPNTLTTVWSIPELFTDPPIVRLLREVLYRDYLYISFSNAPVRARRLLWGISDRMTFGFKYWLVFSVYFQYYLICLTNMLPPRCPEG